MVHWSDPYLNIDMSVGKSDRKEGSEALGTGLAVEVENYQSH